jgi:uncharacterized protein
MQYCIYNDAICLGRAQDAQQSEEAWHQLDTSAHAFLDPLHITRRDQVVEGEQRWQTIGMVNGVLLVLIAYAVVDDEEEVIRIISARRVTRQERIGYEEASET